jgi:glycosyltransferase involved in cell wall biosynthesis
MVKVSVIIPTYNCRKYIACALNSVIKQGNLEDLEVIIVDDGSTDNTAQILDQYSAKFDHFKVITTSGVGVCKARNQAVAASKADYIAFLDADDIWLENKLWPQYHEMKSHPSQVMTFTNYKHFNTVGKVSGDCFHFWPHFKKKFASCFGYHVLENAKNFLFAENIVGTSSVMLKKSAFDQVNGFDEDLESASDWDLWLKISELGEVAYEADIKMHYLMQRDNSITSKALKRYASLKKIFNRHKSKVNFSSRRVASCRLCICKAECEEMQKHHYKSLLFYLMAVIIDLDRRAFMKIIKLSYGNRAKLN